eukprot:3917221-Rhodomonas_salina.4
MALPDVQHREQRVGCDPSLCVGPYRLAGADAQRRSVFLQHSVPGTDAGLWCYQADAHDVQPIPMLYRVKKAVGAENGTELVYRGIKAAGAYNALRQRLPGPLRAHLRRTRPVDRVGYLAMLLPYRMRCTAVGCGGMRRAVRHRDGDMGWAVTQYYMVVPGLGVCNGHLPRTFGAHPFAARCSVLTWRMALPYMYMFILSPAYLDDPKG